MCVFSPFVVVSSSPIATQSWISTAAVHKIELRLWPDAISIHLVGFDCIYKVTAARHSAKSADIAAIMVNICYSWSPLRQGYRYRYHHGKYLLLPITAHHGLSIAALYGENWWSILAAITQCCNGSFTIARRLAIHHSTSTPPRGKCDSTGSLLGWLWHK